MLKPLIFIAFITALIPPLAAQSFPRTVKYLERQTAIPGMAYAITKDNKIIASGAIGVRNVNTGEAVTTNTLFHIGSTNKSITAFILARLVDTGLLSWNSRLSSLIPLSYRDYAMERIKLSQLMNMTSGILDFSEDDFYDLYGEDTATPNNVISFIQDYRLPELPGREFSYSNLSASVAAYAAIYASSGNTSNLAQGYADLIDTWVLKPLNMERSTIFVSETRADPDHAVSHNKNGQVAKSYDRDDDALLPSGALKSSANEMARYIMTMAQKGISPEGERLLSFKVLRKLWRMSAVSRKTDDNYGMGWEAKRYANLKVLQHDGAYDSFSSMIAVIPARKVGFVVLANTETGTYAVMTRAVKRLARDARRFK